MRGLSPRQRRDGQLGIHTQPFREYSVKRSKVELYNKLSTGLYREVLDSPTGRHIQPLIKAVCLAFMDLQELRYAASCWYDEKQPNTRAFVVFISCSLEIHGNDNTDALLP